MEDGKSGTLPYGKKDFLLVRLLLESIRQNWSKICGSYFQSHDIRNSVFKNPVIVDNGYPFDRVNIEKCLKEAMTSQSFLLCNTHLTDVRVPTWTLLFRTHGSDGFEKYEIGTLIEDSLAPLSRINDYIDMSFDPHRVSPISLNVLGIDMGVQALESYLRSGELKRHLVSDEFSEDLKWQALNTARKCYIIHCVSIFFGSKRSIWTHDNYDQAAISSQLLADNTSVLNLGGVSGQSLLEISLQYQIARGYVKSRQLLLLEDNYQKVRSFTLSEELKRNVATHIEKRCSNTSTLWYMEDSQVLLKKYDGEHTHPAFHLYNKLLALRNNGTKDNDEIAVVLYLHSFADAVFVWGKDHFYSQLDFSIKLVQVVDELRKNTGLNLKLYIKLHPVTIKALLDFKGHDIYEKDAILTHCYLTWVKDISFVKIEDASKALVCLVDDFQKKIIVVTHHGSVAIECLYLGIPVITSKVSPTSLFDVSRFFSCVHSLYEGLYMEIGNVLSEAFQEGPRLDIQDIANYYIAYGQVNQYKYYDWHCVDGVGSELHDQLTIYSDTYDSFSNRQFEDFKGFAMGRSIWRRDIEKHKLFFEAEH